ncbi:hypothetical protein [Flavobacterium sp. 102]|uniref:hypothetical protein n=1 Tax=Flavobacterium sp. 102 TaxID=2135623 RepID=UPI000EB0DE49|nr:hypothetical protein [Flavobacterium sp. 102]RKS02312.1 RelA/SpoT family protein [Flavobacterium sp. 102]
MHLIEREIKNIGIIINEFEDDISSKVYQNQAEIIVQKLKRIIDASALKYNLISKNSVRDIRHYNFISRIKEPDSLKEKLIRNNLINDFINEINFENLDANSKKAIKQKLFGLDDLIGVKILTDLNVDCKNMCELIQSPEFQSQAETEDITFNKSDLAKQPQIMRNGLAIYKIRCSYDKYNFELQIKSKLVSAWGDMEHSIFYKDYAITPVRHTAQKSMNHVGKLLFDIDDFVESIRNANKDYKENANALLFLSWFEEKYSTPVKSILQNVTYKFDSISEILYRVSTLLKINLKEDFEVRNLRIEHFDLQSEDGNINHYIKIRNNNYDLKILESILISWLLLSDEVIDKGNLDNKLKEYLATIINATSIYLIEYFPGYEEDEMIELITELYEISLKYECNESFLINIQKLQTFLENWEFTKSIIESKLEDDLISIIGKIIFIFLNNGNYQKYISDTINDIELKKSLISINRELNSFPDIKKKVTPNFLYIINELIKKIN